MSDSYVPIRIPLTIQIKIHELNSKCREALLKIKGWSDEVAANMVVSDHLYNDMNCIIQPSIALALSSHMYELDDIADLCVDDADLWGITNQIIGNEHEYANSLLNDKLLSDIEDYAPICVPSSLVGIKITSVDGQQGMTLTDAQSIVLYSTVLLDYYDRALRKLTDGINP